MKSPARSRVAAVEAAAHRFAGGEATFAFVIAGYLLGAVIGTFIAKRIAGPRSATAVPLLLGMLAAVNLFSFPHPVWFAPAAIAALFAGWVAGNRLARSTAQSHMGGSAS